MKTLKEIIIEKLKIGSKSKISKDDIKISFNKDTVDFPNKDIDNIIDFAYSLPLQPAEIDYFAANNEMRIRYPYEDNKCNNQIKTKYAFVFKRINLTKSKGYRIEYFGPNNDDYEEYPEFPKITYLDDCFEYIQENFYKWIK